MDRSILIVSNSNRIPLETIIALCKDHQVYLLMLWPLDLDLINELEQKTNIKITNSDNFISDNDHLKIAAELNRIIKNWWQELFKIDELNISGLKISKIFEYEFQRNFGKLFLDILSIKNALKKINYKSIYFFENQSESYPNSFSEKFNKTKLSDLFSTQNEINVHTLKFEESLHLYKMKKSLKSYNLKEIYQKIIYKYFPKKNKKDAIVISNSTRCLSQFIQIAELNNPILILYDKDIVVSNNNFKPSTNEVIGNLFFLDIEISLIFLNMHKFLIQEFYIKKEFYYNVVKFIKQNKPKLYITINLFATNEIVKMWAFKKSGIRIALAPEGLGQPNRELSLVMDTILCPEFKVERWLVSKANYLNYYKDLNLKTRITGYLQYDFTPSNSKLNNNRVTVFLGGTGQKHLFRPIIHETIFGIIKFITDIVDIFNVYPKTELIIKVHPGDHNKVYILNKFFSPNTKVKIIIDYNSHKLIENSDFIIAYDTSSVIESLAYNKNVIIYDYTNRTSYINSISKYLKNDLHIAKTKIELNNKIKLLIESPPQKVKFSELSMVLENHRKDYNLNEIVDELILDE